MIVADTSVWIANLKNMQIEAVRKLEAIRPIDQILVGDLVLLEVLRGARDAAHAKRLEASLRNFELVQMVGEDIAVASARNYRKLRGLGITIGKTVDLIIATFCLAGGHELLHDDPDFVPFEQHLGLRCL